MQASLFGTDGIRAPFGEFPLDRITIQRLGFELAQVLSTGPDRPKVILGGDTRASTPQICRWLAAGLTGGGAELQFGGVLTTPAVASLTRQSDAAAGITVSASHNPHPDNGIKIFASDGYKLSDELEQHLERQLAVDRNPETFEAVELHSDASLGARYLEMLADHHADQGGLEGLRIAIDSANGAASPYARRLFEDLGAQVVSLFDTPNGSNINLDCGSTHPEKLAGAVVEQGCDLGVALDGDADRAILVDDKGEIRDGDAMLYLWARDLASTGKLPERKIVATTMSNLGLEKALDREGVGIVRCEVGDRVVVATLQQEGLLLGGEQSGHLVHLGISTTGDGLVSALQIAAQVHRTGRPLSCLLEGFHRYPQVLSNVRVLRKPPLDSVPAIAAKAREVESRLEGRGRLVLRYSGTEPLARVMIEGREMDEIEALAAELVETIERELGA